MARRNTIDSGMGSGEPTALEWLLEPDDRPIVPITFEPALDALYFEVVSDAVESSHTLVSV